MDIDPIVETNQALNTINSVQKDTKMRLTIVRNDPHTAVFATNIHPELEFTDANSQNHQLHITSAFMATREKGFIFATVGDQFLQMIKIGPVGIKLCIKLGENAVIFVNINIISIIIANYSSSKLFESHVNTHRQKPEDLRFLEALLSCPGLGIDNCDSSILQ